MAEQSASKTWMMRFVYFALILVVLFLHLLPMQIAPVRMASPDIITALTFAWAVRRPEYVPMLAVAAVLLVADLVLQRPPGLWAALALAATEVLKSQGENMRDSGFVTEWATIGGVLLVITIAYQIVVGLLIVAPGTLFLMMVQFGLTIAVYPIITSASFLVLGIRRASPGEVGQIGRSL